MLPYKLGTLVLGGLMLQQVVEVAEHFSLLVALGQSSWQALKAPLAFVLTLAGHTIQVRKVVPFSARYSAPVVLYAETRLGLLALLVQDARGVECLVEHISGSVVWVEIVPEEQHVAVFVVEAEYMKVWYFAPLILLEIDTTM